MIEVRIRGRLLRRHVRRRAERDPGGRELLAACGLAQRLGHGLTMVLDVEGKMDSRHPPRAKLALDAVAAGQRLRHALERVGHARLTCDRLRERASRQLIRLVPALVGCQAGTGRSVATPSLLPTPNPLHALREKGENRVSPYPQTRSAMWLAAAT